MEQNFKAIILMKVDHCARAKLAAVEAHHDFSHAIRVNQIAQWINSSENGDSFIIQVSALLHDIGLVFGRKDHEVASARIAENLLNDLEVPHDVINSIADCITSHRSKAWQSTSEAMALWDADKLDRLSLIRHMDLLSLEKAGQDISNKYYEALGDLYSIRERLHFTQSQQLFDALMIQIESFLRNNSLHYYLYSRNLLLPGIVAPCNSVKVNLRLRKTGSLKSDAQALVRQLTLPSNSHKDKLSAM